MGAYKGGGGVKNGVCAAYVFHGRPLSQIECLARQINPENPKTIIEAYKDATTDPYSYLVFDFNQNTPDNLRLRSRIFPDEDNFVYISKNEKID